MNSSSGAGKKEQTSSTAKSMSGVGVAVQNIDMKELTMFINRDKKGGAGAGGGAKAKGKVVVGKS